MGVGLSNKNENLTESSFEVVGDLTNIESGTFES